PPEIPHSFAFPPDPERRHPFYFVPIKETGLLITFLGGGENSSEARRVGGRHPYQEVNSNSVYWAEHGNPERFSFYENGFSVTYRFDKITRDRIIARKQNSVPRTPEVDSLVAATEVAHE